MKIRRRATFLTAQQQVVENIKQKRLSSEVPSDEEGVQLISTENDERRVLETVVLRTLDERVRDRIRRHFRDGEQVPPTPPQTSEVVQSVRVEDSEGNIWLVDEFGRGTREPHNTLNRRFLLIHPKDPRKTYIINHPYNDNSWMGSQQFRASLKRCICNEWGYSESDYRKALKIVVEGVGDDLLSVRMQLDDLTLDTTLDVIVHFKRTWLLRSWKAKVTLSIRE